MAIKIRLTRVGRKKIPGYRLVVAEARRKRDGRIIENLGNYDPRKKHLALAFDRERLDYWVSRGARPTARVAGLLRASRRAAKPAPAA